MRRALLIELLDEGLSIDGIATRVARSPSTVSYWLKRHGLKANGAEKYGPKPPLTKGALEALTSEGLSVPAIAKRLSCTPSLVRYWLDRHGLKSRQASNRIAAREALREGGRFADLTCLKHGRTKHVLEGRGSFRCSRCRGERVAEHRRRVKRVLVEEAGGCCALCGYDRCVGALQFHHLDPTGKIFHLSLRGVTRSLEKLREEARKCVLLCATCHAEVEAGYASIERAA